MKKYRLSFLIRPIAFLLNILTLNISIVLSYFLKFGEISNLFQPPYLLLFWLTNISWLAIIAITKPPVFSRISFNIPNLIVNYTKLILMLLASVSLFWVSFKSYYYSRAVLFYVILLTMFLGFLWRVLGVIALRIYRSSGRNLRSFAVLGKGDLSTQIHNYYLQSPELGFKNKGIYEIQSKRNNFEELVELCQNNTIDVVYACLPYLDGETIQKLITISERHPFEVKIISDFRGFLQKGLSVEYHGYIPVLNLSKKPYSDPKVELVKRIFDLLVSISAIVLLSPLLLSVSLITKFTSKGSIIYTQERIGRWGIPFKIFKFRSMFMDSEVDGPSLSSGLDDKRITNWGRIMRKTRIDELPQFLNVIRGEMSIVGPRPERQYFIDQIVLEAPEYNKLLTLRPGITSIGQVKYGYASSVAEMVKRMKYDLLYLKKYSLETDLQILFMTVRVVLQGRGK